MGNGALKLVVWGGEFLCLTIARAKVGEREFSEVEASTLWEAGDVAALCERLANSLKPRFTGNAHLQLHMADESRPTVATLGANGVLQITFDNERIITLECAMDEEVAWIEGAAGAQWKLRSASEKNSTNSAPLEIEIDDGRGFIWEDSGAHSTVVMVREREQRLFIATATGETEEAAKAAVSLARQKPDINPIYHWKQFWRTAPRVFWPDAQLQKQWNIALFGQAQNGATADVVSAFSAFLARAQNGDIHVLPAVARQWSELSFDNVRCENGFVIGADLSADIVSEVRVSSEYGGLLRLISGENARVEREMAAGETWVWRAD